MSAVTKGWWRWLWGLLSDGARKVEAAPWARFGGGERRSGPVVVFTGNIGEAQVVRGLLEFYNIPAMVQSEGVARVLGVVIGPLAEARVLVPEPLAERARSLLESQVEDVSDGQ